jgi:hypothetical protein
VSAVVWTFEYQDVPGHPEWQFRTGLGGPCWFVLLKHDSYTHVTIDFRGSVDARQATPEVVRWLLDNHPPLDSWVKPPPSAGGGR